MSQKKKAMGRYKYTPANNFYGEMTNILLQYTDEIQEKVNEAVKLTADTSKKELKVAGSFKNRTGRYRKGWKIKFELSRYGSFATVYNSKYYPLTHLLENGHQLIRGGRYIKDVKAFPHISTVNDEAQKMLEEEIEKAVRG